MQASGRQNTFEAGAATRVWIAFGVLALSLAVVAVTPVIVSMRTRALRSQITEVAEPTIAAISGVERALALQLAVLRGYALEGDSSYLAAYRQLEIQERQSARRLVERAPLLGPEVTRGAERLLAEARRWDAAVAMALAAPGDAELGALLSTGAAPIRVMTEAETLRRSVELLERLRRKDIAEVEEFEIWLNRVMIVLAVAAALSLFLIGRRMQAITRSARESHRELERENSRRERLIRGISHDLKNPLGAASAHAEFLDMEMKGPLTEDQRTSVRAIRRSVRVTVALIDDLLQLARAERGEVPIRPEEVDFARLVAEVAEDSRSGAEAKGLGLEVEIHGSGLHAITDPRRVREILENLVTNAIRYTPRGGHVRITAAPAEPVDEPHGRDGRDVRRRIRLAVSDDGPGVAPADRERIFQEFERAGRDGDGSGLGLAISREMARLLGGDIELVSEVGRGSTFALVLPPDLPDPPGDRRS